ncbi:MAG: hypothetical protein QG575_54 [Euryarchaeota archaeon]|nr:hypothetical protein [Euryarchaeota archaeon]
MLRKIDRFRRLTWGERRLILAAYLFLWFARIGLWTLPFGSIRNLAERDLIPRNVSAGKRLPVTTIIWSVRAMCRYVPQATCLTQALAGKMLLATFGHESCLRIGVARDQEGKFLAHAWLEDHGRTILGESESKFIPLLSWRNS